MLSIDLGDWQTTCIAELAVLDSRGMARKKRTTNSGATIPLGYRVFVSHATADKWIARTVCSQLERAGIRTFRDDRDIEGGDSIPDRIRQELVASNELLLLLTPVSKDRQWVWLEAGAGWAVGIRIVFVLQYLGPDQIPGTFKDVKAMELNDLDILCSEIARRGKAWSRANQK